MRKQDFYGLPRSIQDRFIESSRGAAAPAPLAVYPRSDRRPLFWSALSLATAGLWAAFLFYGVGDLRSSFALSNGFHQVIHVAFAGATLFFAFKAYAISSLIGKLPYGTGDYLFPSGVISASFGQLLEYDARTVKSVEAKDNRVLVKTSGRSFTLVADSPERARDVVDLFQRQKEIWEGVAEGEPLDRARLHPLTDSGLANPLAPTEQHPRPRFVPLPVLIGVALVLGLGIGVGVSTWRDSLSQKALYRHAVSEDSIEGYRAYLERGGNRSEVKDLLLPRAELRAAIEQGTVEAIVDFKKRHPGTQISGEVQHALRAALLKELDKAKAKGSLTALNELPKKFPSYELIAPELAAAKQAAYVAALSDFQAQAAQSNPEIVSFVQQTLNYAQEHGPRVVLRYHQEFPQDPSRLDQIVQKSKKYFMGQKSLPTQYILGDRARSREKEFLEAVRARLQKAFPEDILKFELAPLPTEANQAPPAPDAPEITFMHRERLSGGYVGGKPKAMYLGVALHMTAQATVPGVEQVFNKYAWNAWRNPQFSILADRTKDIPDVYEEMVNGAFDKYLELYLARWFESP